MQIIKIQLEIFKKILFFIMIKYNLKCENKHEFESWFSDSKEFDRLKNKNLIECIFCQTKKVEKSIMAPSVASSNYKIIKKKFQI